MKNRFRAATFFLLCSFLAAACSQIFHPPSVSAPNRRVTASPTSPTRIVTPSPSVSATPSMEPTPTNAYIPPTLIPTIEPGLVPGLLRDTFSIRTMKGVNDHNVRQVTGWKYGLADASWPSQCFGYYWLDASHLLIYPRVGQISSINSLRGVDVASQPVVINLESGRVWLPRVYEPDTPYNCSKVYWSQALGIIIKSGFASPQFGPTNEKEAVFTYTFDGENVAHYWGKLLDVSPSGTKILVADDTIIDLGTNEITELDWYMNYDQGWSSDWFWTSDESRVYRCCYYFGDTVAGKSYGFYMSDMRNVSGKPVPALAFHTYGQWVRNDQYFLIEWSWLDDGDVRFLPMFDPEKKIYYDVREMAGIPDDWTSPETTVSPDGNYVWMAGWGKSYLVNLINFNSVEYSINATTDFYWSPDSRFAWLKSISSGNEPPQFYLLSMFDKEIKPLRINPFFDSHLQWHPTDAVLAFLSEDGQKLEILDAGTLSVQELELPFMFRYLVWSPSGIQLALIAEDGSLWKVDYPTQEHLEQLTLALPEVRHVNWSPDEAYLAFVNGSVIYIVDVDN